jgi:hypothetical protein
MDGMPIHSSNVETNAEVMRYHADLLESSPVFILSNDDYPSKVKRLDRTKYCSGSLLQSVATLFGRAVLGQRCLPRYSPVSHSS